MVWGTERVVTESRVMGCWRPSRAGAGVLFVAQGDWHCFHIIVNLHEHPQKIKCLEFLRYLQESYISGGGIGFVAMWMTVCVFDGSFVLSLSSFFFVALFSCILVSHSLIFRWQ